MLINEENNKEIRDKIKKICDKVEKMILAKFEKHSDDFKSYWGYSDKDEKYDYGGSIYELKKKYQERIDNERSKEPFDFAGENLSMIIASSLMFLPLIGIGLFVLGLTTYKNFSRGLFSISYFLLVLFIPILIRYLYIRNKQKKLDKMYAEDPKEVIKAIATAKLIKEKRSQLSKIYWQFENLSKEINSD